MTWDEWKAELKSAAERICPGMYGPDGPAASCGDESWRGFWEDGYSPAEAIFEDTGYGDPEASAGPAEGDAGGGGS